MSWAACHLSIEIVGRSKCLTIALFHVVGILGYVLDPDPADQVWRH
jgi:hypothetical protein